ncbi:hypothetical protein [Streptomyces sp. NPDC046909]|uniref:hypothetical protein n=1 Tax=Streptomyces sp. NPDC046909 TaxID=3155617 RepID=UPI0033C6F12D
MAQRKVSFFDEVSTVFADLADELKLTGPEENELVLPCSIYKGSGVEYRIMLNDLEGRVGCTIKIQADTVSLTADIEPLAIVSGAVEKRGGISYSARNQNQLQKSLLGLADYVRRVHPFLVDPATAVDLIRKARA